MNESMMPGMGWIPDVPNVSDYDEAHPQVAPLLKKTRLAAQAHGEGGHRAGRSSGAAAAAAPALAPAVDLRPYFSPIEDQGSLGSCTANAAVALVEYYEKRATGKYLDASRLFVYKTTRNLAGLKGDSGAEIRNAMGALVLFGDKLVQNLSDPYKAIANAAIALLLVIAAAFGLHATAKAVAVRFGYDI